MNVICDKTPPPAPTNLKAKALSATEIRLTWRNNAPPSQLAEVSVQRQVNGQWITQIVLDGAASSYTDTQLQPGTRYIYRVVALDEEGEVQSPPSKLASATTKKR